MFAQLITKGVSHGVHAFFVPIRTPEGELLPGVQSMDDGVKGGLNGIDNGRLCFDRVRIPRENLLNRYGDVAPDGTYTSDIASPGRRFFTMIGTLVQGRVSLDGASVRAMQAALTIAIRYASERRQFRGPPAARPCCSTTGSTSAACCRVSPKPTRWRSPTSGCLGIEVFSGAGDTEENREDLETLAAALKPLSTWAALDTLQEAREACGGAGFMAKNRLTGLRADLDIYVTFEGDNNVLLQLVGKRLLADYAAQFKNADRAALAKAAAGQIGDRVTRFGLQQLGQTIADFGQTGRSVESLRDPAAQRELLAGRVESMISEIAMALRGATKGIASGDKRAKALANELAFNAQQHRLIEAARAHAELLQWDAFTAGVEKVADPESKQVLTWLRDLSASASSSAARPGTWCRAASRGSASRRSPPTSIVSSPACAITRSTWSTPSGSAPSCCAPRSPPASRASARPRPTPTSRRRRPLAPGRCRRKTSTRPARSSSGSSARRREGGKTGQ